MESDLEELHDSEQRWAAKHKRAIEQVDRRLPKPADSNILRVLRRAPLTRNVSVSIVRLSSCR